MRKLRVEDAQSGQTFDIILEDDDYSVAKLKVYLHRFVPIFPQDQVLLVGPPYYLLETQYNSSFKQDNNGPRIFLYNKSIFSGVDSKDNSSITFKIPADIILEPDKLEGNSSTALVNKTFCLAELESSLQIKKFQSSSNSPIISTIFQFERQFLSNKLRADSYIKTTEKVYESCRICIEEQKVQYDALSAAYNHLHLNFDRTRQSFEKEKENLLLQLIKHSELLENFETNMKRLTEIPILPKLILPENKLNESSSISDSLSTTASVINRISTGLVNEAPSNETVANSFNQNLMKTLSDFIPIAKEREWFKACAQVHRKVKDDFDKLQSMCQEACMTMNSLQPPDIDILTLTSELNNIELAMNSEKQLIQSLRDDYNYINSVITKKFESSNEDSDNNETNDDISTLKELEKRRKEQESEPTGILCQLKYLVQNVFQCKNTIFSLKSDLLEKFSKHMRHIAVVQSNIITKLKKGLNLMKQWHKGHNEYFSHLDGIASLPNLHLQFLYEINRRISYHNEFKEAYTNSVSALNMLRENEINERQIFMKNFGLLLPPIYFQLIPSLKDKPPYLNINCSDIPVLPNVTLSDINEYNNVINQNNFESDLEYNQGASQIKVNIDDSNMKSDINEDSPDVTQITQYKVSVNTPNSTVEIDNSSLNEEVIRLKQQLAEMTDKYNAAISENNSVIQNQSTLLEEADLWKNRFNELNSLHEETRQNLLQKDLAFNEVSKRYDSLLRSVDKGYGDIGKLEFIHILIKDLAVDNAGLGSDSVDSFDSSILSNTKAEATISKIVSIIREMNNAYIKKLKTYKLRIMNKISYLSFNAGDLALFMKSKTRVYAAFNTGCPHYYLSTDCLPINPDCYFILGKIIVIDKFISSAENNPYEIELGKEFHVITVETVESSDTIK